MGSLGPPSPSSMKMGMAVVVALVVVVGFASSLPHLSVSNRAQVLQGRAVIETQFQAWMTKYEKEFDTDTDYLWRLGVYASNLNTIDTHNRGNHSWFMRENEYSHLTAEEFKSLYTMEMPPPPTNSSSTPRDVFQSTAEDAPDSVDWVAAGAVTGPKSQGQCGSCWSFSTTGALEGAYFIKNHILKSFSEEMLVACDKTCNACGGGLMDYAFDWIATNGGLCSEEDWSYTSGDKVVPACDSTTCTVVPGSRITRHTDVSPIMQRVPASAKDMMAAIAMQPVSVAIEADQDSFQHYGGGVMTQACGTQLDHGVLAVGYGTDAAAGGDYWKIKNSWGPGWGEQGYIRIARLGDTGSKDGQCGILLSASFPSL